MKVLFETREVGQGAGIFGKVYKRVFVWRCFLIARKPTVVVGSHVKTPNELFSGARTGAYVQGYYT